MKPTFAVNNSIFQIFLAFKIDCFFVDPISIHQQPIATIVPVGVMGGLVPGGTVNPTAPMGHGQQPPSYQPAPEQHTSNQQPSVHSVNNE